MLQLKISRFQKGSYIIVEGKDDSDRFYIIQQGTIICNKSSRSGIAPVKLGPGDFLGVVSCFSGHLQIETAIAQTDVTAICVQKSQYPDLIVNNTGLALKIIKSFANRMREMNEMLTKATLKGVVADSNEQIFNVANFYEKQGYFNIACFSYYQYLKTRPVSQRAQFAKQKYLTLKQRVNPVYLEPTAELQRKYPKDAMIFSEASKGAEMFIIQQGDVAISKVVDGNEVTLAVLHKGDMFGEMALLENKPRSASAIAHSDCVLMVVNRANFNQMVSTQPQMITRLTTTLSERLWSMYRQLENASLDTPIEKMIDMLSLQIEKTKPDSKTMSNKSIQTDFSAQDIANMCGIPQDHQGTAIYALQTDNHVKIVGGKIFIKDYNELIKTAAFYRKGK